MRRITVALLSTLSSMVLLLAYPTSHNASVAASDGEAPPASEPSTAAAPSASAGADPSASAPARSTSYTGKAVQTRWGVVQVQITVQNGKITRSRAVQYPNDNGHDQEINAHALPILAQEAVAAQSASIDAVSGATVTSDGYTESLQSALDAAHL